MRPVLSGLPFEEVTGIVFSHTAIEETILIRPIFLDYANSAHQTMATSRRRIVKYITPLPKGTRVFSFSTDKKMVNHN